MVIDTAVVGRISSVVLYRVERRDGNQLLLLRAIPHTPLVTSVDRLPSAESGAATPVGARECWRGRAAHDTLLFCLAVTDSAPHPPQTRADRLSGFN